jgi:uncharacterized membrane protein YecN with MAPEG domain
MIAAQVCGFLMMSFVWLIILAIVFEEVEHRLRLKDQFDSKKEDVLILGWFVLVVGGVSWIAYTTWGL